MKKVCRFVLVIFSAVLILLVSSCGQKTGKCENCGKTELLFKVTITKNYTAGGKSDSDDESVEYLCKSCSDEKIESLNGLSGLLGLGDLWNIKVEEY